jgi:hypothetical protein
LRGLAYALHPGYYERNTLAAVERFGEAVRLDPKFAILLSCRASRGCFRYSSFGFVPARQGNSAGGGAGGRTGREGCRHFARRHVVCRTSSGGDDGLRLRFGRCIATAAGDPEHSKGQGCIASNR